MLNLQRFVGSIPIIKGLESYIVNDSNEKDVSSIFIIGPPRTGSTMLFQILLSAYKFSYITNLSSLFYTTPVLITAIFNTIFPNYRAVDKYSSRLGYVNGLWAPSEAGQLYRYWFEKQVDSPDWNAHVKKSIKHISQTMEGPFLFKNLNVSIKINNIEKILPNSLYIFIRRNPLYVAQSIILMRRRMYQDISRWWSVKPPDYDDLKNLDPFEQIVRQIKSIEDCIQQNIANKKSNNIIEIWYEDLCSNWQGALTAIQSWCAENGVNLIERKPLLSSKNIPLKKSEKQILNEPEWERLQCMVDKIYHRQSS